MQFSPRTWIEIDTQAIKHNIAALQEIAGGIQLAPVIKSNAYGHGNVLVGKICDQMDAVSLICVAFLSEALQLRAQGVKKPILVLTGIDSDINTCLNQNIQFTISSYEMATELDVIAREHACIIEIHLKIDTGLGRFGIAPEQAVFIATKIALLEHIKLVGIYTHLAEAGTQNSNLTPLQISRFQTIIHELKTLGICPVFIHCANSAGTILAIPECTVARPGLGLYGIWPAQHVKEYCAIAYPNVTLIPALSWKTHILHIRTFPAHTAIGYEQTYRTIRDTRIGILPIGYYDGYHTQLGNRAQVLVENHYGPVIGRVAMNTISIDITDIPTATIGSIVTLIGTDELVSITTLTHLVGSTNTRQMLCQINSEIPRIASREPMPILKNLPVRPEEVCNTISKGQITADHSFIKTT